MGTEVQFKMLFLGYQFANSVNEKAGNRSVLLSCDDSTMKNGNQLNALSGWSPSDIHFGFEKKELRQMILQQEAMFRHQLHELHRLYKIQRDIMNEIKSKDFCTSLGPISTFQSHFFSSNDKSKQHVYHYPSGFPKSGRIPSSEGAQIASKSKFGSSAVRWLFDLELPADEYITEEHKIPPCSQTGLPTDELSASAFAGMGRSRKRLQRMEYSASSQASFNESGSLDNLKTVQLENCGNSFSGHSLPGEISSDPLGSTRVEFKKILEPVSLSSNQQSSELQRSGKIFGVELSQRNHESQLSLQPLSSMSFMKSTQDPEITEDGLLVRGPQEGGGSYQMSSDSLLINFHQLVDTNKMNIIVARSLVQDFSSVAGTADSQKRGDKVNGCLGNEKTLGSYMDKSHSAVGVGSFKSNLTDNSTSPNFSASGTKCTVDVERFVEKNVNACTLSSREFLDLNVCPTEEEASSTICSEFSHVKPVRGEIDLEVPVPETSESPREESTDSKQGSSVILDDKLGEKNDELLRVAAECLITISSISADKIQHQIFPDQSKDTQSETIQWFADVILSSLLVSPETDPLNHGEYVPKGMDYFEFATLNLAETEVKELSYKPPVSEEQRENSSSGGSQKGHARRGRQKRDFQRDVLPGLTSLSRKEVTEDLQMIEGLLKATGRASRQGLLQRNRASKGSKARGRTNRRSSVNNDLMNLGAVQKLKCRELGINEGALMGWGKRARRPKRPRCSAAIH